MNLSQVDRRKFWPPSFKELLLAGLVVGLAIVFVQISKIIWMKETFVWDAPLMLAIHQISRPWLDGAAWGITQLGEGGVVIVGGVLVVWLGWRQHRHESITLLLSATGSIALSTLLKIIFARPRPMIFPPLVVESDFSFPSGHVIISFAVYGWLSIWMWRQHHPYWAIVFAGLIPLIAFSRIYLGVHYPSDILGTAALGGLWLMAMLAVQQWLEHYVLHKKTT